MLLVSFRCLIKYYKLAAKNNAHILAHGSGGQKSGHGVAGFSAQGLTRLKSSYHPGLWFSPELRSSSGVLVDGRIHFLWL